MASQDEVEPTPEDIVSLVDLLMYGKPKTLGIIAPDIINGGLWWQVYPTYHFITKRHLARGYVGTRLEAEIETRWGLNYKIMRADLEYKRRARRRSTTAGASDGRLQG